MKILVLNSTPLIYLAKIGLIDIISNLKADKITPTSVKHEVVDRGRARGAPEAEALSRLFDGKVIRLMQPKDESFLKSLFAIRGLAIADAEVLALAKEQRGIAIIDDKLARSVAKVHSIPYSGTAYILISAVEENLISKKQAKNSLDEMIAQGWRCGPEDYAQILRKFDAVASQEAIT